MFNFITDKVTNIYKIFYGCSSLTELNLSNFTTSNVINMGQMFGECYKLIFLNISNYNYIKC